MLNYLKNTTLSTAALAVLLLTLLPHTSQAVNLSFLPFKKTEMARVFNTTPVALPASENAAGKIQIGPQGADVTYNEDGDIIFTGMDKGGKKWQFQTANFTKTDGYKAETADLDGNGITDLIVYVPIMGVPPAPEYELMTLMFDSSGAPIPFSSPGYLQRLFDFNKDKRAEFLHITYDYNYWIATLYEAEGARWKAVNSIKGPEGRRTFPMYFSFTNQRSVPPPGTYPFAFDVSNTTAHAAGRIMSYKWGKDDHQSDAVFVVISTSDGKTLTCKNPFSAILIENETERTIVTSSASRDAVITALNDIINDNYNLKFFGFNQNAAGPAACVSSLIWAKK
ncbi:MAG: hypothetical protein HQK97_05115 [Nitrospirae bacterium]|uniref:hypothetical protein n=1 Tax=Candidatus Magnetominusculus dajiuhuensis TaxID=3137712 RepID=UPI0019E96540|nr:hypothetical protein [Nitrospirota bacterium]